ncbi:MAG: LAGLIDADG family homing endonuclease [Candidatus Diapherotrites archaeon]|nr:LAGLIDADG family homing endonuclease [Candidatus Diapherotrites archaeon]
MKENFDRGECELIGAIMGDGYIYTNNSKYVIGLTGNIITDKEYFEYLKNLIEKTWDKKPQLRIRSNGIRLRFNSKAVVSRLIHYFEIPYGKAKAEKVKIPQKLLEWEYAKHVIRGIVDTDGSIFVANKPGSPNYPSIEITTVSHELAIQLRNILIEKEFRVANIWSYKSKLSKLTTFKVPLNGVQNVRKWVDEISFSNPYKFQKALAVLNR